MTITNNVKLLWPSAYWDGPITGMCIYNEQKCWFSQIDEYWAEDEEGNVYEDYREYGIYKLTPEQLKHEEEKHNFFEEKVGKHTNYINNKRDYNIKPNSNESEKKEFYNKYNPKEENIKQKEYLKVKIGTFKIGILKK